MIPWKGHISISEVLSNYGVAYNKRLQDYVTEGEKTFFILWRWVWKYNWISLNNKTEKTTKSYTLTTDFICNCITIGETVLYA